jgi:hypothetical protein
MIVPVKSRSGVASIGPPPLTRGSANYAGLLPVELSDEPRPIRPTTLENERFPNGQPSLRERASRALLTSGP